MSDNYEPQNPNPQYPNNQYPNNQYPNPQYPDNQYTSPQYSNNQPPNQNTQLAPIVEVGEWVKLFCLTFLAFIPVLGFIAVIVLYIVKLTSEATNPNIRNFLKAYGILILINIAISIVVLIMFGAAIISMIPFINTMGSY